MWALSSFSELTLLTTVLFCMCYRQKASCFLLVFVCLFVSNIVLNKSTPIKCLLFNPVRFSYPIARGSSFNWKRDGLEEGLLTEPCINRGSEVLKNWNHLVSDLYVASYQDKLRGIFVRTNFIPQIFGGQWQHGTHCSKHWGFSRQTLLSWSLHAGYIKICVTCLARCLWVSVCFIRCCCLVLFIGSIVTFLMFSWGMSNDMAKQDYHMLMAN